MPTDYRIAPQTLIIPGPPMKLRSHSLAATGSDVDRHGGVGGVSYQCQASSPCPTSEAASPPDAEVWDQAHDHREEAFEQWDALVQRENSEAYAMTELRTASERVRYHACLWCYEIVDKYRIDRSTVSIALSYFDRLVSSGLVEREDWTVAFVTCLYLAVKVYSYRGRVFFPQDMATISERVTKDQILDMEHHICQVFDWHLNPPVPVSFIDTVSPLLESEPMCEHDFSEFGNINMRDEMRCQLVSQSKFLCERTVMDTFFSDKSPSSIACASVLVAMDLLQFPVGSIKWFVSLPIEHDTEETELCAQRLHQICSDDEYQPSMTFDDCIDHQTSQIDESNKSGRTVTPTKEHIPSSIKRIREEVIVEFSQKRRMC